MPFQAGLDGVPKMKFIILIAAIFLNSAVIAAGPISKFEEKTPDVETTSSISIYDIERCLTDLDGWPVPFIYRQPDRPDETNILWVSTYGQTMARAHLKKVDSGVAVRIWKAAGNQARSCIQSGKPK